MSVTIDDVEVGGPRRELLTISEFCARYAVSRATCYRLISAGQIKALKVRSGTRIPTQSAQEWFATLPSLQ